MRTATYPALDYIALTVRLSVAQGHCTACDTGGHDVEWQLHGVFPDGETQHDGASICPACFAKDPKAAVLAALGRYEDLTVETSREYANPDEVEAHVAADRVYYANLRSLVRDGKLDLPPAMPLRYVEGAESWCAPPL